MRKAVRIADRWLGARPSNDPADHRAARCTPGRSDAAYHGRSREAENAG